MQDFVKKAGICMLAVAAMVSVVVGAFHVAPAYRRWQHFSADHAELQARVDTLRQAITETRRDIDRFNRSPYFVEQLARANHRVADNEIVLIFED